MSFFVVCREDSKPDGSKGDWVLATRREFASMLDALDHAVAIALSREPRVLTTNLGLKTPEEIRLTDAHSRAADLLGEIAANPELRLAIKKASPEVYEDLLATTKEWDEAGEAALRSLHK